MENGERIQFWEDLSRGGQPLCSQFLGLYRVISVKNVSISTILGSSFPFSWNFNFRCNLTDIEIELLERLMSSLNLVHLSPPAVDSQARSLSSSGLFTIKSFSLAMSNYSNPTLFLLGNFLWKSKAPSKVKTFAWLVAHRKVNTNDMLQLKRPYKSLSPH